MSILHATRVSRAPIAALAAVGVFWGTFAAYIPDIKAQAGATDAALGLALLMSAAGGMAAMYLSPRANALLGRYTLPVGGVLAALAFLTPLAAGSVPRLGLALFAMGASIAFLDIGANVRISVLEGRHRLHLMNLNHAMFSFGFAAAAFTAGLARKAGWGSGDLFPAYALILLALAALTTEGKAWVGAPPAPDNATHGRVWAAILPVAAILFAAFVSENAVDNWSALHIERTLGGPAGNGGFGPAMLGLTMGFGRLSGQFAAQKLGEAGLIFWSSVVGCVGAVVMAAAPTPLVAILGVGLFGLGVAVTVPSANSILGKMVRPDQRGYAISRAWMVGFTGFFLGPTMMGQISQLVGLRAAFLFVALMMAAILPCIVLIRRRGQL
jgi:MFS family permease